MAWVELPDDCPESKGEECPVVEHEKRRSSDKFSPMRITMALITALGVGSGGYLIRDRVVPATPSAFVDLEARGELKLLRVELAGELKLIQQQLSQLLKVQEEEKTERERLSRRLEPR